MLSIRLANSLQIMFVKDQLNQFTKEVESIHVGEDTNTREVVKQLQLEIETRLREKMNRITSQISEVVTKVNSQFNTTITTLRSRIEDVSANQLISIDTVEQESIETLLNNLDPIIDQLEKTRSILVEGMTQSLNNLTETVQKLLQETVTTHKTHLFEWLKIRKVCPFCRRELSRRSIPHVKS